MTRTFPGLSSAPRTRGKEEIAAQKMHRMLSTRVFLVQKLP
jgi:hypothetical protein